MNDETHVARAISNEDVAEVMHRLTTAMMARAHYGAGHPALARADIAAAHGFESLLARYPELVLALIDDEFVLNERPFPELRRRLPTLADAMARHGLECIVFQRGITSAECGLLGAALADPTRGDTGAKRAELQSGLTHVLLRFAALKEHDPSRRNRPTREYLVPAVQATLEAMARDITSGKMCDLDAVRRIAATIVASCASRTFALEQRAYAEGLIDDAAHATNVATITAAILLDRGASEAECVEAAAAALVHDLGVALLPAHVRGVPLPLLSERDAGIYRQHPIVGASALLCSGCPPLWVAAALDHHRGVDGRGYPALDGARAPHETVRIISLANYFDRRRTIARGASDEPDEALRRAAELESRYFGPGTVASFLRALGVYPPGTIVELSNGATAMVLHANPSDPLRPQVEIMFGSDAGKRLELKDLDAFEDRYVASIVRAIPPPLAVFEAPLEELPQLEELGPADEDEASAWPPPPPASLPPRRMSLVIPRTDAGEPVERESLAPARAPTKSSLPPPIAKSDAPPDESALARLSTMLDRVPRLAVPASTVPSLDLDTRTGFVLSFVDGVTTLDDILDAVALPRWEVARMIEELVSRGVLALD